MELPSVSNQASFGVGAPSPLAQQDLPNIPQRQSNEEGVENERPELMGKMSCLSLDLLAGMLRQLSGKEAAIVGCVCKTLLEVSSLADIWRHFISRDFAGLPGFPPTSPETLALIPDQSVCSTWRELHARASLACMRWEQVSTVRPPNSRQEDANREMRNQFGYYMDFSESDEDEHPESDAPQQEEGTATQANAGTANVERIPHQLRRGYGPYAREGHAAAECFEGMIAIFGGFSPAGFLEVILYDPDGAEGQKWSGVIQVAGDARVFAELASGMRYGLSATRCRGVIESEERDCIVVMGGFTSGGYSREIASFLVLTWKPQPGSKWPYLRWEDPTPKDSQGARLDDTQPLPRAYHSATWLGSSLFVYGGISGGDSIADVALLDLATWRWDLQGDSFGGSQFEVGGGPGPRFGHSATAVPVLHREGTLQTTKMVVVGGARGGYDILRSGHELDDVWEMELEEGGGQVWRKLHTHNSSKNAGRCHSAVLLGRKLVLYGGLLKGRRAQAEGVSTLDLDSLTWSSPKLARNTPPTSRPGKQQEPCDKNDETPHKSDLEDEQTRQEEEEEEEGSEGPRQRGRGEGRCPMSFDSSSPSPSSDVDDGGSDQLLIPRARFSHTGTLCSGGRMVVMGGWHGGAGFGGGSTLGDCFLLHLGVLAPSGSVPQPGTGEDQASASATIQERMRRLVPLIRTLRSREGRGRAVIAFEHGQVFALKVKELELLTSDYLDVHFEVLGIISDDEEEEAQTLEEEDEDEDDEGGDEDEDDEDDEDEKDDEDTDGDEDGDEDDEDGVGDKDSENEVTRKLVAAAIKRMVASDQEFDDDEDDDEDKGDAEDAHRNVAVAVEAELMKELMDEEEKDEMGCGAQDD